MTSTLRTYIICTTARSGSNLLCDYLFRTGRLGRPTETFNPQIVVNGAFGRRYDASQPLELSAYIEWAKENFATRNGVLGIKMLWEDLEYLGGSASLSDVLAQAQLFRLTRRRKLAQAVSYYLAVETGQWMASDPARREPNDVPFDYDAINTHLNRLCLQDARWDAELDARGLKATHWYFEDFLRAPTQYVKSLAGSVGVEIEDSSVSTGLEKQSSARSDEFMATFRQHYHKDHKLKLSEKKTYENVEFIL